MKLTKEQKAEWAEKLTHPWGRVKLVCDGDIVTLAVERAKGLKYVIATYVSGQFKGEWMLVDKPAHEQRYLRKVTRTLVSPARRKKAEKEFGKRFVKSNDLYNATYTMYDPTWPNGNAAIAHLCRVCESISVESETSTSLTSAAEA